MGTIPLLHVCWKCQSRGVCCVLHIFPLPGRGFGSAVQAPIHHWLDKVLPGSTKASLTQLLSCRLLPQTFDNLDQTVR